MGWILSVHKLYFPIGNFVLFCVAMLEKFPDREILSGAVNTPLIGAFRAENGGILERIQKRAIGVAKWRCSTSWFDGFERKLTTSKWAAIAKCSQDTALRDITELLGRGVLRKGTAGGRSSSYELNELLD